ncbi:MAG TPA: dihydrofolate reductase family protein, partial [Deltaproteobacteria bacterium]|nr:dihydrofolate reductase family protein [Deltaproteobacteria bacterium]
RGRLPWAGVLDALGRMGLHAVMVEGGSGVYTTLVESALVDRFVFFVAPAVLGGGLGVVDHGGAVRLAQAARFVIARLERMGDDVLVEGIPGG